MPTSARNKQQRQQGLTLFELLVALSILSLSVLVSANAFRAFSPRIAVDQAAEQLVADLKRARLHARQTGERVAISPTETGYEISSLQLTRTLRNDLVASWRSDAEGVVAFTQRFANLGGRVEIRKGNRRAVVLVHPITGKVERVE